MDRAAVTLRNWLQQEISTILARNAGAPSYLVWCDPDLAWKDLLQMAAENGAFELWADEIHQLILRERLYRAPHTPRVVWLPVSREDIGYFEIFALLAEEVRQEGLPQALSRYGVNIPTERWHELAPLLPAYAKTWIDYPLDYWHRHFPGPLIDDDQFLQILAGVGHPLTDFLDPQLAPVFYRRAVEDFGLPDPQVGALDAWRVQATATLLITDAAQQVPNHPPAASGRIITAEAPRRQALKLLAQWQQRLDMIDAFERLTAQADGSAGLDYWAGSLPQLSPPLASPGAERSLFQAETSRLALFGQDFAAVARHLSDHAAIYQAHNQSFWGRTAGKRVRWSWLVEMAAMAQLLHAQHGVEKGWQTTADAVTWFTETGWQVDYAGESIFREEATLPDSLQTVRQSLRLAYQRHLDRTNRALSELLSHQPLPDLHYAGEIIGREVEKATKNRPVAVVVLDACRYDVGRRLAALMNAGEPKERAEVTAARAPLPSITPIGMPHALPGMSKPNVTWTGKKPVPWHVEAPGFSGNLAVKGDRISWLKQSYKLSDAAFMQIGEVMDGPNKVNARERGHLLFVFADELDDHEGNLKPHGLDREIERYAALLRQLRAGGYSTIFVVTDHGFFHWEGDADEHGLDKPEGEILYASRRAMAGHGLQHNTALFLPLSGNNEMQCAIPRSIQAFKTHGGLGYFHGGATLQEIVIPVLAVRWPQQMRVIGVVLKPISQITSLTPRLEVEPEGIDADLFGNVDEKLVGRRVQVVIRHAQSGHSLFESEPVSIEPGGDKKTVQLTKVEGTEAALRSKLDVIARDADSGEILDRCMATLMKELDAWF